MTATLSRPKRFRLREDYSRQSATPISVDETQCIIRGLKICGLNSDNGRDYSPECLQDAKPLYEGKPCYTNHRKPGEQRDFADDIGVWYGVKFVEGKGLFADLHYDNESIAAKRLVNRAKRLPENIGFSHDADTDTQFVTKQANGRELITKITEVNSVDLVAKPATASSLTEGAMKTVKQVIESKSSAIVNFAAIKPLLEDDAASAPAEGDGYTDAVLSAIAQIISGDGDAGEKAKKIKSWLKAHEDSTAAPVAEEDAPGDEDDSKTKESDSGDTDDEDKKKMETRLETLERRESIRNLCETLDFVPNKKQMTKLEKKNDEETRRDLVEAWKAASEAPTGPRSKGTSYTTTLREQKPSVADLKNKYRIVG